MGVTRFPNGLNIGNDAGGTSDFQLGGTIVTPTAAELNRLAGIAVGGFALVGASAGKMVAFGTVVVPNGGTSFKPSGLTTALVAVATPVGLLSSTAGTVGGFTTVAAAVAAGGTITITGYDQMGTASLASGTAFYAAFGT